jgi:hypothetical protein
METRTWLFRIGLFLAVVLTQLNCSPEKRANNNNTAPAYNPVGGYYMSNGSCYSPTGQIVNSTYCSNSYYMSGNYCYSPTGQVVSNTYCSQTGAGTGTVGTPTCNGTYYYCSGNQACQQGVCGPANNYCRGYTLRDQAGNQVVCQ